MIIAGRHELSIDTPTRIEDRGRLTAADVDLESNAPDRHRLDARALVDRAGRD
jgi:hypothetical protein